MIADKSLALKEHDIEITARSTHRELGEFLHKLNQSAVTVTVSGLTIIGYPEDRFRGEKNLDVNLALTTYLSKEE